MRRLPDLLKRFRKDERGVFLVIFALLAVVIIAASGAVVDFTRVQQARTRAQNAIDSAALALQGTINNSGVTAASLKLKAQDLLTERMGDTSITAVVESATPDTANGKLTISGYISVPTYFVQLVGIKDIRSTMLSEVTRSSSDLEVSLSIDITGSMAKKTCSWLEKWFGCTDTDKIGDLIIASNNIIDKLVSTTQTPTYSKMAIVPWSYAVNVGSTYADAVRGAVTGGVTISSATWMSGTSKTISGITKASPAVVTTSAAHGFSAGDFVYITDVSGMTNVNNNIYKVGAASPASTTKFKLLTTAGNNVDSSSWTAFSSSGSPKVTKCLNSSCQVLVTTSSAHGLSAGETVYIASAGGMTTLNAIHASAVGTVPSTTTYYLTSVDSDLALYTGYTANSGKSYCTTYGCQYYYFANRSSGHSMYQPNTCVTERATNTYTDTPPSTSLLSKYYPDSSGSNCISNVIVPLTSDKAVLHAAIGPDSPESSRTLKADGSTAGHLGLAWGWYMISPNFAYLWPTASRPKAYGSDNLIKAVIFMTDGEFNQEYCTGVVDSTINCDAPGNSQAQAETLCTNIKASANKTYLYVVGFDLGGNAAALDFLDKCATDDAPGETYFFQADNGADLNAAFNKIAQSLSDLRISK